MTTNPATRPRLLAALVITLALVVGGLAGATLDRAVFRPQDPASYTVGPAAPQMDQEAHRERRRAPGSRGPGMPMRASPGARYLDQLTRDLDLSEAQRARIEELLQQQQDRMRALRQESRQHSGAIVTETRAGIFEILTPEQRAILDRTGRASARGRGPVARHLRGD